MRRTLVILIVALAAAAVAVVAYAALRPSQSASPATQSASPATTATAAAASGMPHLAHVFVIVMENKSASEIAGNSSAPFINGLMARYAYAADYSALTHPSLPNYIALTSGSFQGITDDRNPPGAGYAVDAVNLADRIDGAGLTWKAYAESLPSAGYADNAGQFATRHEPFLYYKDILQNDSRRIAHIVPFTQMATDLRSAATTPSFAFITPNVCNDMHDCPVSVGDAWLSKTVPVILGSPAFTDSPSLLVVTWDEGSDSDNHVVTILAGNSVKQGFRSSQAYDHYSLLHTIEAGLGLQPMTASDGNAAVMSEFFRR
jgi:hypothetical protein